VLRGRVVTPGLIDAHTAVGLTGYLNQEQDQDQLDKGEPIQPELRALDSYNPRERLVEWVRGFGITTIHTGHAPGALVSGQTMVVKTVGETVGDAVVVPAAMVAVTLGDDARPGDEKKSPGTRSKAVAMLRGEFVKTQDYLRKLDLGDPEKRPDRDLRRELSNLERSIAKLDTEKKQANAAMLAAIGSARRSIGLASYIFDNDPTGRMFVDALAAAVRRGVAVRVLVDGIGATYSRPPITGLLAAAGVPVALFLPTGVPFYFPYANLRNHRKILVVDGEVGFTGGLNVRDGCWLAHAPKHPVRDMHFRLQGPVVAQLLEVFAEDWQFAAGESLDGDEGDDAAWSPHLAPAGTMLARGIRFGPDDPDVGRIRLVIVAALAAAQKSVRIMTPYFLPDDAVCQALDVAALRGVEVDIVIPGKNNLSLVGWATTSMLWQVLGRGCHVWLSPPPFDHTKLLVVDDAWAMFGSGNWDERSLRLNFEFNVETYDRELCATLGRHVAGVIARSRPITLDEVDGRSLPVRLRDGIARLFSPYL